LVDINPSDTVNTYAPRQTTLVDAVAESKRIADQVMRSNPVENATVTKGATQFIGNYGNYFMLIGEFFPADPNLVDDFGNQMPQRGIVFRRDDPQQEFAFAMYDWSPQAGVPLRQKISMHDADGKRMMVEGGAGGRNYPDKAIPLYPRISVDNGANSTSQEVVWMGSGNLIGTHMHFTSNVSTGAGPPTVSNFVRYSGAGVTVNSPTFTGSFNTTTDVSSIFDVSDFITVEYIAWRSGGSGLYYPRPGICRNFSQ
jgi:hypothetical protein